MKASQLRELIRELIQNHMDEMSTTGALVQSGGEQITTTKAWKKINKNRKGKSINENEDEFGWNLAKKALEDLKKNHNEFKDYELSALGPGDGATFIGITVRRPDGFESKFDVHYNKEGKITKIIHKPDFMDTRDIDFSVYNLNESYRKFKKKITNPRQQMNNSVREIEKHLREVDKIIEYNLKLKTEMNVGGGTFYEGTNKRLARISERMNQLNNKLKELGN